MQREKGEQGIEPDLCGSSPRKPGSEFLLPGLGSSRGAMVGLRGGVRGRCARLLSPEAESFFWFV